MKKQIALVFAALLSATLTLSAQDSSAKSSQQAHNSTELAAELQLGHPISTTDPVIPRTFRDQNVAVVLSATMTKEGTFQNLVFAGGEPALGDASIAAVKHWLYTPSTQEGEPVNLEAYVILNANRGSVSSFVEPNLPFPTNPSSPGPDVNEKIYRIVRDMQAPRASYAPDPEYSRAARAARLQGTVLLGVVIGSDGNLTDLWVKKGVGLGLDQKALDTVRRWKFQPAVKNGEPIAVYAVIEVAYHLD
ncbi:MAG: energy transducer TonB [Terriglobales bacterium]